MSTVLNLNLNLNYIIIVLIISYIITFYRDGFKGVILFKLSFIGFWGFIKWYSHKNKDKNTLRGGLEGSTIKEDTVQEPTNLEEKEEEGEE